MSKKVVIVNANYPHYEVEKQVLSPYDATVEHVSTVAEPDKILSYVRDADAIMTRETPLPAGVIGALTKCSVIVRYGVGVDNIDLEAARAKHICVANVPDYGSSVVVSEHAMALMFAVARRVVTRDRDTRNGAWDIGAKEPMYCFEGKKAGIIGCGKIGRAFARKISGIGFETIYGYDPYADTCEHVQMTDPDTIFRECDVISLHMPLTKETQHIINTDSLAKMKKTAILVNTSRGGLVDTGALADALKNGRIYGAGIDVFEEEPPEKNNPLFALENCIVSDHTGWYAEESQEKLQRLAAEEVARVFAGGVPEAFLNPWEED